jgi:hypothetical protein
MDDQCFFTAIWQEPTNGTQAGVTYYIVSLNGNFKFNKTDNVTSDIIAEFSASFQDTCETGHMISVAAGSICGMGPPVVYTMDDQEEYSELKTEHTSESYYASVTVGTSTTCMVCRENKGEVNTGNGKCT